MPLRHKDARIYKEDIYKSTFLVQLCAFAPWWQNITILSNINIKKYTK